MEYEGEMVVVKVDRKKMGWRLDGVRQGVKSVGGYSLFPSLFLLLLLHFQLVEKGDLAHHVPESLLS